MDEKIRAFVAVKLPLELTDMLGDVQSGLKKISGGEKAINRAVSWVKPENIHLTLKFLGHVEKHLIEKIIAGLEVVSSTHGPFKLTTAGVGGFPGLKNPRVLWLGILESVPLTRLWRDIEQRLKALGLEPAIEDEKRGFKPHLTLCRIKSVQAGGVLAEGAGHLTHIATMDFTVDSIVLFKSVLSPAGARHEEIKRISLKGVQ
ncbi:MAG: RNA 2',3'-cyclic phosphodiesterase [Deltaproteobacteria bacterium]